MMYKPDRKERHRRILALIEQQRISTQGELVDLLRKEQMDVTQATVSRDIKTLNIVKMKEPGTGKQRYVALGSDEDQRFNRLIKIFADAVTGVNVAGHMIVMKTMPGMAQAGASAVDALDYSGVLGCVAGDDTIFIVAGTPELAALLTERFAGLLAEHRRP